MTKTRAWFEIYTIISYARTAIEYAGAFAATIIYGGIVLFYTLLFISFVFWPDEMINNISNSISQHSIRLDDGLHSIIILGAIYLALYVQLIALFGQWKSIPQHAFVMLKRYNPLTFVTIGPVFYIIDMHSALVSVFMLVKRLRP